MNLNILNYSNKHLNFGRDVIKKFISNISFENVLDIGAGNGQDLLMVKQIKSGVELFAIENYEESIKKLKDESINCFPIDIEKDSFPFQDKSLDLIIGNQILEHTKELFWIFHEISRTLKDEAYLILGVPNLASFHNRVLLGFGKQPSCIEPLSAHVRGFTKDGMERFAKLGGLELVAFKGSNFYPFPQVVARMLSIFFPQLSVGIFFVFKKKKVYNNEYLEFPLKNKLSTNYFLGTSSQNKDL